MKKLKTWKVTEFVHSHILAARITRWVRPAFLCLFCVFFISLHSERALTANLHNASPYFTSTQAIAPEDVSRRALIALPQDGGSVYLGWRFLRSDQSSTSFNIYRSINSGIGFAHIATVSDSTNFLDETTSVGETYFYIVKPETNGVEGTPSNQATVTTASTGRNYFHIPLARNTCGSFNRNNEHIKIDTDGCGMDWLVIGDLNGDGMMDYVVKTPETPYTTPRNNGLAHPYHLEAYLHDGTFLWEYDTGLKRDIDGGTHWNSSYTVWDMDGDGHAEVMTRASIGNSYYLVMLDGTSGEELHRTPWLPHTNTPHGTRPMIGIAYLDGIHPAVIVSEGTYGDNITAAYDSRLNEIWSEWFQGGDRSTSHHLIILDTDGDGKDEILQSSNLINDDGSLLFSLGYGHSDGLYAADIDPDNPGFEAFFATCGSTNKCKEFGAVLFDLDTGHELWHYPAVHLHGAGYVGEIIPESPGLESMADDEANNAECSTWPQDELRVFSAKGDILYSANPSWQSKYKCSWISWDDDELCDPMPEDGSIKGHHFMDGNGDGWADRSPNTRVTLLNPLGTMDILGDFREEFIMMSMTHFYIYTNTDISQQKKATPLEDRHYRQEVARTGSGYGFEFHELGYGFEGAPSIQEDINQDGIVDILDVQLCVNVLSGIETDPEVIGRADVDGNGSVDPTDVQYVIETILQNW